MNVDIVQAFPRKKSPFKQLVRAAFGCEMSVIMEMFSCLRNLHFVELDDHKVKAPIRLKQVRCVSGT